MLSQKELERYSRQILINGFGEEGQAKLKRAKVFIAGVGGLGSVTATYLAAAGVGTIRVATSSHLPSALAVTMASSTGVRVPCTTRR